MQNNSSKLDELDEFLKEKGGTEDAAAAHATDSTPKEEVATQEAPSDESFFNRIKTGITGLDDLIQGGFPQNTVSLVSGPPGSGKTILTFQFLDEGIQHGDNCLFLTNDKRVDNLLAQAKGVGIDFRPAIDKGLIQFLYLEANEKLLYDALKNEVIEGDYDRIVLDSITPLGEVPLVRHEEGFTSNTKFVDTGSASNDLSHTRTRLHYIMDAFSQANATTLVTSELPADSRGYSRDTVSEFLADGVIILKLDPAMDRRKLTVMKMRGTQHTLKPQDIEIGEGGIRFR